ncbi:MAG: hypothetical protein ABI672_03845, partial [Vicinamibacteria bacterium]
INRLAAFVLMREHRFDEALPVLERIQKLDQDEWLNFALDHVTTLAALGRKDDAVKLAQSAFRTGTGDQKSRLAAFVSWLGPPASAAGDTLIGTIPGITPQQRTHWRLRFWLAANDVNVSSVAIAPHPLLPKLEVDAHFHPDEALVQIATTEPDALLFLGPEVLTLFKGEALRQHNEAASKPIDQALETLGLPISDLNAYLNEGAWSTDVDELPLSIHASLYAARSRSGRVPPAEKARLRDLARQCDPAGGFAQRALATWPVV